jgi:LacI family transcriptional regulator
MSVAEREADDLSAFCCQNPACPDYGQRGRGNLTVPMRYGPQQRRLLRCKTCKARFPERKGTPLFGAQLPEDKVVAVLQHIAEGVGVRKTGRLVGVNRNTVVRYSLLAGQHAQHLHDELVAFSPPDAGGAVRREVVVRGQEGEALRPRQPRR